jgi:uncharacterized protein (TIGR02145 family)
MSNKLAFSFSKTRHWLLLLISISVLTTNCKKKDTTTPQPNTNFQLGLIETPSSVYAGIPSAAAPAPGGTLPSSFFLEIPTQPFYQGSQGSCVSCATAMSKSILDHIKNNVAYKDNGIIYSPAFIFNQVHLDPNDCSVGSYVYANLDILKNQGVCKISDMPYKESDCQTKPNNTQVSSAYVNRIDHYYKIDPISIEWIKEFIHIGHAVIVAFQVDDYFIQATSSSLWKKFGTVSRGKHATLLYGWDDSKHAFKMLNSWGTKWGDNGTIWVDYDFVQSGASSIYGKIFTEAYIIQNPALVVNYPPIADFDANGGNTAITTGQQISFKDKSSNTPTSWTWTFSGGTPNSSSAQNPTVTYNTAGTYSVTLKVSNSYGSDSKTRTGYVTVTTPVAWSCGQDFTDPRDGNIYKTININGQCWLAENLRYKGNGTIGVNYANSNSNYTTFGRLYSFDEVQNGSLAPAGWHIPTKAEGLILNDYVFKNFSNYGGALKSTSSLWSAPNTAADNATGFSALPSGKVYGGSSSQLGLVFYMWSSTPQSGDGEGFMLQYNVKGFGGGVYSKDYYFAVRCLKD